MKRTFLFLAVVSAALLPLAANGQVSTSTRAQSSDETAPTFKYSVYAGYAYTSLNQVNQSRYGLQGVNVSITRNFGRYFGVTAEGDYYPKPLESPEFEGLPGNTSDSIKPTVTSVLLGPVIHAQIYGKFDGFIHGLLGGEHTGGLQQTPNISFAGGFGGGVDYNLNPRFSVRASGDLIGASFSVTGNSAELGYSPHKTWDPRASIGVVYHF